MGVRLADGRGISSAFEIGLAFNIWGCKAKSLLDAEMLCSSFQIRFYLISSAEWNL